jgi:hypothetical protein
MQFDREKLKALVLYACSKCNASQLGAVKLHKVLYFSDMLAYANTGVPVTGAVYRKRPHGPTCDALLGTLGEMQRAGLIAIDNENYYGFWKKMYLPLVPADPSRFSADELKLIDEVIEFVCKNNSARTISEFSHNRAWDMAEFGEELPYTSAFYMFPNQASKEALDWAEGEADAIESQGSKADPLGFEDYAAFRSRVRTALR